MVLPNQPHIKWHAAKFVMWFVMYFDQLYQSNSHTNAHILYKSEEVSLNLIIVPKHWNTQTKAKMKFGWWLIHHKCEMSVVEYGGEINTIILNGIQNTKSSTMVFTMHLKFRIVFASSPWIVLFCVAYEFPVTVELFH